MSFIGPEIFMKIVHAKSQSLCLEAGYPHFCHFSDVMHVTLVLGFILIKLKKVDLWHLSWYKLRHAGTKYSLFYYDSFHRFCVAPPQTLKNGVRIVMHVTRNVGPFVFPSIKQLLSELFYIPLYDCNEILIFSQFNAFATVFVHFKGKNVSCSCSIKWVFFILF